MSPSFMHDTNKPGGWSEMGRCCVELIYEKIYWIYLMHSSGKDPIENEIKGPFLKTLEGDCTNFLSLFITFTLDPSDFMLLLNLL